MEKDKRKEEIIINTMNTARKIANALKQTGQKDIWKIAIYKASVANHEEYDFNEIKREVAIRFNRHYRNKVRNTKP